jgi:ELWxxDGT repeat protein
MRLLLLAFAVFFAAQPATAQYEVSIVADINPGSPRSSPSDFAIYDSRLFFRADDGIHGYELWAYDATTNEANLVTDLYPGSDGSFPGSLTVYDGRLFFSANDGQHGRELWVYNADTDTATLAADIHPGSGSSFSGPLPLPKLTLYDDRLFFRAYDGLTGTELWGFDAATDEAALVSDINHGSDSSQPSYLTVYDNRLFFQANDGYQTNEGNSGPELWAYDASTDESSLVVDIRPGIDGSTPSSLTVYDDRLFFAAYDGSTGNELWVYDAVTTEATIAADINPESDLGSDPGSLTIYNGRLFFRALDWSGIGDELWAYDAATNEVNLIAEVRPGINFGDLFEWSIAYNGRLYFDIAEENWGRELWAYDAATDEIGLVMDIFPGTTDSGVPFGSFPSDFTVLDNQLFFSACNLEQGCELWGLSSDFVANEPNATPRPAHLHAPHPNPARDRATVSFDIAEPEPVRVEVFDVLGRRVALLEDGPVAAGEHSLTWEADALPSGLYLVRLTAGDAVQTQRLTLAR